MPRKIEGAIRFDAFRVEVDSLLTYPRNHPRWDARSAYTPDPAMVANVKARGVIKALKTVVLAEAVKYQGVTRNDVGHVTGLDGKTHTLEPGIYVVDGHQRRAWAKAAKAELVKEGEKGAEVWLPTIPVDRTNARDEDYLASLSLAANQHVSDTPMVIAEKLRAVAERYGGDVGKVAVQTGFSATFVKQHLAMFELSTPVQRAVEKGEIAVSAAAHFAKLEPADQKKALEAAKAAAPQGDGRRKTQVTVRQASKAAKTAKGGETAAPTTDAPGKREIKAMLEKATEQGEKAIARTLQWVLTGEGDPLA
jgi:ParB-like chromosome segregation protein Spo0J